MPNRTKVICTIGPSSWDYSILKKLVQAGMDVARLNFSHGTHTEKAQQIETLRAISKELEKPIAIIADLQGPKLRLGIIDGIRKLTRGEEIILSLNPISNEVPIQFDLAPFIKKNHRIFLNDGLIELKVHSVTGKSIKTIAQNSGDISSHKGINIPDTNMKGNVFTQKDKEDAQFALKEGVDYLALSFIQKSDDINPAKELIKKYNPDTKIIVKVEKKEAIDNLESIIHASNAIMVARGDLAIETAASQVPIAQQRIIKLSRQHHRPVIIATQMLESMIENPRATRAEVSDVANAVMDQVDCVMLSAESASGKYPVEAVETMQNIISSVEKNLEYKHYIRIDWENLLEEDKSVMALSSSAASLAYRLGTKAIVVGTATGKTARILSSFRPDCRIIAITHDLQTQRQLNMVWGVEPYIVKPTSNFNVFLEHIYNELKITHSLKKGDNVVVVTGTTAGVSGTTNTIKVTSL